MTIELAKLEAFGRSIQTMYDHSFREAALRGHILRYAGVDDEGLESWTVTPFDKAGDACEEPLVLAEFSFGYDDVEGWLQKALRRSGGSRADQVA